MTKTTGHTPTHVQGTEVQVYKAGTLFTKSVLGSRRECYVEVSGTTLTVSKGEQGRAKIYDLGNASLIKQEGQKRLVIQLATKEKVSLYADDQSNFEEWMETLTDCIEWRIQRFYDIGPQLGSGAFAVVRKGRHKTTRDIVAIKIINKGLCSEENLTYLQREVDIARSLKHRNIVRTIDAYESKDRLYIVLEYLCGGTLDRFIRRNGMQSEDIAREIMRDVLDGVAYLHNESIVHRDLKLENILCSGKRAPMTAKLLDFGLSRRINAENFTGEPFEADGGLGPEGLMTTPVGTPGYAAPEVLENLPYGKEIDLFACGVIMYWMLCGYAPFHHSEADELAGLIKRGQFTFPEEDWGHISTMAKDLISRMLDRSPYARISAADALLHPWMRVNSNARVNRKRTVKPREEDDLDYVDPELVSSSHSGPDLPTVS